MHLTIGLPENPFNLIQSCNDAKYLMRLIISTSGSFFRSVIRLCLYMVELLVINDQPLNSFLRDDKFPLPKRGVIPESA